ncbi:hypothetical protein GCM10017559_32490 [Streptosporangium longisporum]|uniref:Uncharacterized protein n=1 Tax=Streptosporangium longisporum TaxID=46187 RepID=A0ABP6KID1_9ACTN
MDLETGDALHGGVVDDVHPVAEGGQQVRQGLGPARGEQHGTHRVTRRDRAADDLLPLGDEEAVLGLQALAQLDVAQAGVVGQVTGRIGGPADRTGRSVDRTGDRIGGPVGGPVGRIGRIGGGPGAGGLRHPRILPWRA